MLARLRELVADFDTAGFGHEAPNGQAVRTITDKGFQHVDVAIETRLRASDHHTAIDLLGDVEGACAESNRLINKGIFAFAFEDHVGTKAPLIPVAQACRRHERDACAPAVMPCPRWPCPADPVGLAEWIHRILEGSAGIARRREFDGSTKPVAVVDVRV